MIGLSLLHSGIQTNPMRLFRGIPFALASFVKLTPWFDEAGRPRLWLRAPLIAVSGYFLIATSAPLEPLTPRCIEGISVPQTSIELGERQADDEHKSCEHYDGLDTGVALSFDVRQEETPDASSCIEFYSLAWSPLPPELAAAMLVGKNANIEDKLDIRISLEKPNEPGCRFELFLTARPQAEESIDESGMHHIDWSGPLTVIRKLSFPQVQFCLGVADVESGRYQCQDTWTATLGARQ